MKQEENWLDGIVYSEHGKLMTTSSMLSMVSPELGRQLYAHYTPWHWKLIHKSWPYKFWWRHWGCKPFLFDTDPIAMDELSDGMRENLRVLSGDKTAF